MSGLWVMLGLVGITAALAVVFAGWWRRSHRALGGTTLSAEDEGALITVARRAKLTELTERRLFGARIITCWGQRDGFQITVEVCDSGFHPYTRLEARYTQPLEQGVQIMSEETSGALGWLMRFRETTLEHGRLDDAFILLTRDEARLSELIARGLGKILLALHDHEHVQRVTLTDEAIFLFCDSALAGESLQAMIRRLDRLSAWLQAQAQELGPCEAMTPRSYEDAFGHLAREDGEGEGEGEAHDPLRSDAHLSTFAALTTLSPGAQALSLNDEDEDEDEADDEAVDDALDEAEADAQRV